MIHILLGWNLDVGFDSGENDFSIFLGSKDADLDVLHDEIKLNNEAAKFLITSFRKM